MIEQRIAQNAEHVLVIREEHITRNYLKLEFIGSKVNPIKIIQRVEYTVLGRSRFLSTQGLFTIWKKSTDMLKIPNKLKITTIQFLKFFKANFGSAVGNSLKKIRLTYRLSDHSENAVFRKSYLIIQKLYHYILFELYH